MIKPIDVTERIDVDPLEKGDSLAGWNTANSARAWAWKEQYQALPMSLLYVRYHILRVNKPYREVPKDILRELSRVAPGHDIRWVGALDRWGLFKQQKAFYHFKFRGSDFMYCDYYPRMVSLIEGPGESYIELSMGILKYIVNQNNIDPYREAVRMRDKEERHEALLEQEKENVFEDYHKVASEQAEIHMRDDTGRVPDFSVNIPFSIPKNNGEPNATAKS